MSTDGPTVHRLAAFTDHPDGGNPAGVVVTDTALPVGEMQRIAAEVGYSETAFLHGPSVDHRSWQVRYFSPVAEVPFCGHATIAAAVVLGGQVGTGGFTMHTAGGPVPVEVGGADDALVATLTSIPPGVQPATEDLVSEVVDAAGLAPSHLDERYPPAVAFAGAHHLLLVLVDRSDLRGLSYDFDRVLAVMTAHELTTVAYLWPAADGTWHARNLFPVGGVIEDPATGAAAAAFGAYLRSIGAIATPGELDIVQGEDMGRPSRLHVLVPSGDGGISVSGRAVHIPTTGVDTPDLG
jgi:PhzF family phenazine biosynthesis protein